jgi:hypothetical protein
MTSRCGCALIALATTFGTGLGCASEEPAGHGDQTGGMLPPGAGAAGSGALPGTTPGMTTTPPSSTPTVTPPTTDPGTTPPATDPGTTPPTPTGEGSDPTTPFAQLPASCKGFEVLGLQYSPGGDTLPNTCAPFESIYNNPYAIRCTEADPTYDTGFPGDEFCILPPSPEMGTQVHVAPADYANPAPQFVMEPGEEVTDYYYTNAPNTEERWFYRVNLRMRAGSHHMINRMLDADREDGFSTAGGGFSGGGGGGRSFPGAQRPNQDRPMGIIQVPPENAGLGDRLLANQQFSFNLHHFNFQESPALREVWVNIWYKDASEVVDEMGGIAIFGNPLDVSLAPGEHRVLEYSCAVQGNTRIITLNGHRHTWTDRFGVWLERGGETIPLYESFHYDDMPTYQYDSISMNPTPDMATKTDGAFTGILEVATGDELHFVCDVNNTSNHSLRFANEVETGEMCILFGSRTGDDLCSGGATRVQ